MPLLNLVSWVLYECLFLENVFFAQSSKMVKYLSGKMVEKQNLFYILVENEKLAGETVIKVKLHVAGSQKLHMKAFHSDGEIIIKRKHVQL